MDSIPRFITAKLHPETITYKHPLLKPILNVTYGCLVYQEQVIEVFRQLAGYTLGQADNMRRAISKKKQAAILQERKAFVYGDPARGIPGAIQNGVDEKTAQAIYDEILDFANYAFNKAHAVCYAKVSYDTAYLKCHYPKQYMAALMTSVLDSARKISEYIAECKDLGIAVLPPDINESEDNFTVVKEGIRFGLVAVKNIGKGLIRQVMAERENAGRFQDFEDFCRRMYGPELNKRAMENLIKCGSMDGFGLKRSQLLAIYELVLDSVANSKKRNVEGQMGMFDLLLGDQEEVKSTVRVPNIPELSKKELMQMEKETTGLYLTGHPMDDYRDILKRAKVVCIADIMESFASETGQFHDEQQVSIAGVVQTVKMKTTRNNSMMAYVTLEDDTASMELLVFSGCLNQYGGYLKENMPIVCQGKISVRDEKEPQLLLNSCRPLSDVEEPAAFEQTARAAVKGQKLYLRLASENTLEYRKVKAILSMFPGTSNVVLYFQDTQVRRGTVCDLDAMMVEELQTLLGEANVVVK